MSVAFASVLTADALAVKFALVDPDGIVTVAGTVRFALSLARLMTEPPFGAGAVSVTVHESAAVPTRVALAQFNDARLAIALVVAAPVPFRPTTIAPVEALLETVNWPVSDPIDVGAKFRFTTYVPPGAIVTGKSLVQLIENAWPLIVN